MFNEDPKLINVFDKLNLMTTAAIAPSGSKSSRACYTSQEKLRSEQKL